jgi:predicted DsbA family dithiol-disulfide isomerase
MKTVMIKVEIYSDIVCPWCYIGEHRFFQALSDFPNADQVEVVFRPFQLDPGAPPRGIPLAEYLERRYGGRSVAMMERVGSVAAEEGIAIDWDRALAGNTHTAHRLLRSERRTEESGNETEERHPRGGRPHELRGAESAGNLRLPDWRGIVA